MAVRKGYNRFFIIFQEEDKGYGIAIDKQPTGYAKIETRNGKCKVTVYAQNLKQEKGPYHFCMMDALKTPVQFVKVGEVRVDEIGKGETWWEYNEDNIAGSGTSIDKFNVAVILVPGDSISAPLVGFTGKEKLEWKDKIVIKKEVHEHKHENEPKLENVEPEHVHKLENEPKLEHEECEHEHKHEHEHEHKHEHEHEHKHEKECEENHHKEHREEKDDWEVFDSEAEKFREYERQIKTQSEAGEFDVNRDWSNSISAQVEEVKASRELNLEVQHELQEDEYNAGCVEFEMPRHDHKEHKHKKYKAHATVFHQILEQFEEMNDFLEGKEEDCRWWKIPYNCSINMIEDRHYPFLCTIFHLNMTYPHIDYIKYYHQRGYYYFGIKYDKDDEVKYLMFGIEGRDTIKDQPYMGMTGFGKWLRLRDKDEGIWILIYNPRTGNFMVEKPE